MALFKIGEASFNGVRELQQALDRGRNAFSSLWLKALRDCADIAQKYYGRQFARHGQEFGTPWRALRPSTKADRARHGYKPDHPILVRRGWLRASIVSKTSHHHKREITVNGIKMYSLLTTKDGRFNMMEIHQKGSKRLPARKIYLESWISKAGWDEIKARLTGMFIELRRVMEK